MAASPPALTAFAARLVEVGWVSDLWVAGSLATGDYVPGVSGLDLVAIVDGRVDDVREAVFKRLHAELDRGVASGAHLGCAYVDHRTVEDLATRGRRWMVALGPRGRTARTRRWSIR